MSTYFIYDGRNELGPFTIPQLKNQDISRSTPLRANGTNKWMPADKIEDLRDTVAPRRIKRPKDIVPVVMERAAEFRQRRPKTAYAILLCVALLAGVSFYSLGKAVNKNIPQKQVALSLTDETAQRSPSLLATIADKNEPAAGVPAYDKEKADRLRWNKLFSAANSNYGIGVLGGIKDLKVVIHNRSDYAVDEAIAKITYIKANGEVWKSKLVTVHGIPPHDTKEQSVPDVARGKKVTVTLQKIVSKKMKFSYTAGKQKGTGDDPYLLQ